MLHVSVLKDHHQTLKYMISNISNSACSCSEICEISLIFTSFHKVGGPGSAVGIATGYGLDGPGIESWWGRDFSHLSRPALGTNQPPVQWVPGLFRGKERPGRDADPSPLLVPWS